MPPVFIVGADFAGPSSANEQRRKIVALWAQRLRPKSYLLTESGPNQRLTNERPGWTAAELLEALTSEPVLVAALDFPFSLPAPLLTLLHFAKRVGRWEPIGTWDGYLELAAAQLKLEPPVLFEAFAGWRDKTFWLKRGTDVAAAAQPPLKDKFQNLFQMTLLGAALLDGLRSAGWNVPPLRTGDGPTAIEIYPGGSCRRLGFTRYKANPVGAIDAIANALLARGITLETSPEIRERCATYTSDGKDHDLADAFVALGTAILWRESQCEMALVNGAQDTALEGAIWWPTIS